MSEIIFRVAQFHSGSSGVGIGASPLIYGTIANAFLMVKMVDRQAEDLIEVLKRFYRPLL